jgi:hypothetical protein
MGGNPDTHAASCPDDPAHQHATSDTSSNYNILK